jgi:hypothetical protein
MFLGNDSYDSYDSFNCWLKGFKGIVDFFMVIYSSLYIVLYSVFIVER